MSLLSLHKTSQEYKIPQSGEIHISKQNSTLDEPGSQDDSLHVSNMKVQGLIFGLMIGAFISSSTSIILSILICTITNVPLPEALSEYTGYKTPQQLLFSCINSILSKILGIIATFSNKSKKRTL
jgi:hypothetical protein